MTNNFDTIASLLTLAATIPQSIKVLKTGDVSSFSLLALVLIVLSNCFWIAYGQSVGSRSLIYVSMFLGSGAAYMLVLKIRKVFNI